MRSKLDVLPRSTARTPAAVDNPDHASTARSPLRSAERFVRSGFETSGAFTVNVLLAASNATSSADQVYVSAVFPECSAAAFPDCAAKELAPNSMQTLARTATAAAGSFVDRLLIRILLLVP